MAAALQCSVAMGSSYLRYAMAMRDRLPEVGKVLQVGDIDYRAFQTIVFRTDLITDADVLAKVDAQLAVLLSRCPSVTRGRLAAAVLQLCCRVGESTQSGRSVRHPGRVGVYRDERLDQSARRRRPGGRNL